MEDPGLLIGLPLLILALIGLVVAFSLFAVPAEETVTGPRVRRARVRSAHPTPSEYVVIGLILAMITAVEVALYYIEFHRPLLITTLIVLSSLKFVFVVLWYMHLKFDSVLLSRLFATGFVGAIVLFAVVLATLGAGLT